MKITKFYKRVYLAGIGSGVIWWENKDKVLSCISALGGPVCLWPGEGA